MNKVSGRNKIKLVVVLACLITLLGIGFSYAYYRLNKNQDNSNVAGSKCFKLELLNEKNEINLTNMYPISDEEGKNLIPYTFTLTNTCDIDASYSINLEMLEGTTLDSKYLDVILNDSDIKLLSSYQTTTTAIDGSTESRILNTDTLKSKESKEYSLRFWMDKDVEDVNSMNKVFNSKIVVSAEATVIYPTLVEKVTELASVDKVNFATDDPDNNIRYIGASPNNYIYFNCSDYSNQSDNTCEKWRIIGVFNNVAKSDGTKENLVKIIRDESIGDFSWDYSATGLYTNNWSNSTLQQMLNSGAYYNGEIAAYYNNSTTAINVDFTKSGLKNSTTKNSIEKVVWRLGGINDNTNKIALNIYNSENNVLSETLTADIGLLSLSDYGFSVGTSNEASRNDCLNTVMTSWNSKTYCTLNNYLFNSTYQWTLTPYSDNKTHNFIIHTSGYIYEDYTYYVLNVRPVLYLKSNLLVFNGDGYENSPYQLKVNL